MDTSTSWAIDVPTAIHSGFDLLCLSIGTYILLTRSRQHQQSTVTPSPTPLTITPSLWARKRLPLLLGSTLSTCLVHLIRILLIVSLTLDANRLNAEHAKTAPGPSDTPLPEIINPLTRPPALYGVLALPALMLLSRGLLILAFALPATRKLTVVPAPSSPVITTTVPASPRPRKGSVARATSPTTNDTVSHNPPPSPIWQFISSLPGRLTGPTQNLYLLAFYACIGSACILVPFSYDTYWYLDVPRLEFVLSLYLAAVLQDAKNVPGLTTKEKVGFSEF